MITCCRITYDGHIGVSGGADSLVMIWNIQQGSLIRQIKVCSFLFNFVSFKSQYNL
jgi:hypothetical protein